MLFPIAGAPIDMDRYKGHTVDDIIPFDFISKSIYSMTHTNPKRRIEGPLKEMLDDLIREVSSDGCLCNELQNAQLLC